MDPYATAIDSSPAAPTEEAVPTTRITAGTSPPSALKTYHPYAASLYDVPFTWPPKDVPEHGPSHEDDGVNAYTRQDHQVIQEALIVPSSAPDTSRTQYDPSEIQQGSLRRSRLASHDAAPPHTTSDPTTATTAFQGPRAPHGSQSPYTYGLPQSFAPTQRPSWSGTQNTLSGERYRSLALGGTCDTYPPPPSQQPRRKPARLPTQHSTSHLLALDGASAPPSRRPASHQPNPLIDPALTSLPSSPTSHPNSLPPSPFTCHPCSQTATLDAPQIFSTQDEVLAHMHTQHNMPHSRLCCCGVCRFVFCEMEADGDGDGGTGEEEGVKWLRGGGFGEIGMVDGGGGGMGEGAERTGYGELGGGEIGGREEQFAWPAEMEQVANEAEMGRTHWDGSLDEFVDLGAGDGGQQFDFGNVSSSAGADNAPDAPG
nr:hypothetical protein B0A51_08465 [Rachicladosporium sp. CCFEE 5018]